MEVEMLIAAVRARRPIWDASLKLHSNRDHIMKLWNEIANDLDIERSVAKKKWRALRENYRKEILKKRSTTGQAAGDNWKSRWTHFEDLSFLQDQFAPRKTSGSMGASCSFSEGSEDVLQPPDSETSINDTSTVDADGEEDMTSGDNVVETPIPNSGTKKNKRQASPTKKIVQPPQRPKEFKKNMLQRMVQLEEKKVAEYLRRRPPSQSHEVQDADYHFLMSLLPSLRAVPTHRKLLFRRKIEDLFLEEEGWSTGMNLIGYNYTPQRSLSVQSSETLMSNSEQPDINSVGDTATEGPYEDQELRQLITGFGESGQM